MLFPYDSRDFSHEQIQNLVVDTVDAFQGSERKIILISLVRSNRSGRIGFINDIKRFNVSVTRAKAHLAIFCNVATFEKSTFQSFFEMHESSIKWFDRSEFERNLPSPEQWRQIKKKKYQQRKKR